MEQIVAFLEKLVALDVSPAIIAVLAGVVDFALRLIKTPKAVGVIHTVAGVIKKASQLIGLLGLAVAKLADLSDKVLPQRVEEPKQP